MILCADKEPRVAWALRDPKSGAISVGMICESEESAHAMRREAARLNLKCQRFDIIPIAISVNEYPRGSGNASKQ